MEAQIGPHPTPLKIDPTEDKTDKVSSNSNESLLTKLSEGIRGKLEDAFESHGRRVAAHPKVTVALCLTLTLLSSLGFLNFRMELRPLQLWLAQDSHFMEVWRWQIDNFPVPFRFHTVILEADNILTANSIKAMWQLHKRVESARDPVYNITWKDTCALIPSLLSEDGSGISLKRRKRSLSYNSDFSVDLSRSMYCDILKDLPSLCLENSLLEIWGLKEDVVMNLTDQQVIDEINTANMSKVFGFSAHFQSYLGGVTYNESGSIVAAKSARHVWVTKLNYTAIENGISGMDHGSGFTVDLMGLAFEQLLVDTVLNFSFPNIKAIPNAQSSFGRISEANIQGDVPWIILGYMIMLLFVALTIGKRNLVEQRIFLSMAGIIGIMQSIVISIGLCSLFGVFYSPVNSILPLLMVGLGVDDMFVIMASWENIKSTQRHLSVSDRIGLTMRNAGVSITITSITDVVAFGVGATTKLPALKSFCLYATVGIFSVYLIQITFFLAILIYDEKRIDSSKMCLPPCIQVEKDEKGCSQFGITKFIFESVFGKYFLSRYGKCIIALFSILLIGSSTWGTSQLQRDFNPKNFLPSDSYLFEWYAKEALYYPSKGDEAFLYFSNVTLPGDIQEIQGILDELSELPFVYETSSVFKDFNSYYKRHPAFKDRPLSQETFSNCLSLFLNSQSGAKYTKNFNFESEVECLKPAPKFTVFSLSMRIKKIKYADYQKAAQIQINRILDRSQLRGFRAAFSEAFIIWETNDIVGKELTLNMILIIIVVFLISMLFLASIRGALLTFGCVCATIVSIGGLMWVWGLTIDTVSCIAIVLSVGLSVDYAVHIVHAYLSLEKYNISHTKRIKKALVQVGPAVLQGGLSTCIIFLLMAPSTSHVFQTFFKIFTGSAVFGMYWGLIALPLVLSIELKIPDFSSYILNQKQKKVVNSTNKEGADNIGYKSETT